MAAVDGSNRAEPDGPSHRPHQSLGNVPISGLPRDDFNGRIECQERLGGLLKHYDREAA